MSNINVRRYNNRSSQWNGCFYVLMADAKAVYHNSPKRAAALAIAAKTGINSVLAYKRLHRTILANGNRVYFCK